MVPLICTLLLASVLPHLWLHLQAEASSDGGREPEAATARAGVPDSEQTLSFLPVATSDPSPPPSPSSLVPATDVSEHVEATLCQVVPFLCRLLVEYRSTLSKVLVTSSGRQLLTDGQCAKEDMPYSGKFSWVGGRIS